MRGHHNRMPNATQFPWHGCMNDLITKRNFDSQATCVIKMFGSFS